MVIRWQVAIAAGFFIVATMFIRGTLKLAAHDSGVEIDRVAVATLNFDNGVWDEARVRRVLEYYENQTEGEAVTEQTKAARGHTLMDVPHALVPIVRHLITELERDRRARK